MAKSKPQQAKAAAEGAWGNEYVQRIIQDAELRANVRDALDNARSAYARINNGKTVSKVVMEDKRFQKDVKNAADAFKEAGTALRDGPKRRKRGGFAKLVLLALIGGGLAIALSEDVRNKVLDLLFGKEEEFDYTSTTAPPAPTPAATAST
jgi:predicted transcriptional regulator